MICPYALANAPSKKICLITGDIRDVKNVDIWVSSENTNMIMARHYDRSISSIIRYCGARKEKGRIVEDIVAKELAKAAPGDPANVPAGEIVVTGPGELQRTHGVKKIFHAASAIGQVGTGFSPIDDIGRCVRNALLTADARKYARCNFKSILFPLMGTGTTRGDLQQKAKELIDAAISHLQDNPACRIECVYFLTWSEKDLEVCQHILQNAPQVSPGP
jgi:O-acetyl-ADP-ribose deacetylase (regulator of RNase III)